MECVRLEALVWSAVKFPIIWWFPNFPFSQILMRCTQFSIMIPFVHNIFQFTHIRALKIRFFRNKCIEERVVLKWTKNNLTRIPKLSWLFAVPLRKWLWKTCVSFLNCKTVLVAPKNYVLKYPAHVEKNKNWNVRENVETSIKRKIVGT